MNTLTITAPYFDLYDSVVTSWDGKVIKAQVIGRYYDLDGGRWFYLLDTFKNPHEAHGWFESISLEKDNVSSMSV